jgi:hypothetical protein
VLSPSVSLAAEMTIISKFGTTAVYGPLSVPSLKDIDMVSKAQLACISVVLINPVCAS